LKKRRIDYLAVGVNFRCGYHLDTSAQLLREMMAEGGTRTELVSQLRAGGAPVSSSRIRESIFNGDIAGASELLGRPYSLDVPGLCPAPGGDVLSWEFENEGWVLPPGGSYPVVIRRGGAEFPAEIFIDSRSRRLVLTGNSVVPGGPAEGCPSSGGGDFLNSGMLSVEFRPRNGR
jgi:riboflavin kinase/FMN adenylyltransferase